MSISWLFDRDPVRHRTGRLFRRLGATLTRVNPTTDVTVDGYTVTEYRNPYVVVSNHQSHGDIPILSLLPWEMKWIGKDNLFRIPIVGWMMRMSGDIPVIRGNRQSAIECLERAAWYLQNKCSVMFFPEGTRSPDGNLLRFKDGAFRLAIENQVPILPIVLDGTSNTLPKHSLVYTEHSDVIVRVLPPVSTDGIGLDGLDDLRERVRKIIGDELKNIRSDGESIQETVETSASETTVQ